MKKRTILTGHTTLCSAFDVKATLDTPKRYYWIQTRQGIGDRLGTCTVESRTGDLGPVEYGLDSSFSYLFLDRTGELRQETYHFNQHPSINRARFLDLLSELQPHEISQEQQAFIRLEIYRSFLDYATTERPQLTEAGLEKFHEWAVRTTCHMESCPFERIAGYIPWEAREENYLSYSAKAAA
ncbi:hypothetical protein [Puia dinghuensis]|uniref:Uncharacterized protein n=1 Tax=Puia dinghuensis TaxID=1792502 RepID=A0A8J2UBJ7_9BACT|nr:hypothetical protein [Puia dinghuensis]GGA92855.1 hypothetical protein GCM10011511_15320 [Puia dinghuensis]